MNKKEIELFEANFLDGDKINDGGCTFTVEGVIDVVDFFKEETIKTINSIPETVPEYESDDYDQGRKDFKEYCLNQPTSDDFMIEFVREKLTQVHNSAIEGCVEMIEEEIKDAKQFIMPGLVSGSSPQALAQIDVLLRLKQKLKIK